MQLTNNQQPKTDRAFTLIELLVVIAIVGILAGLAVVNMSGATEAARIAKLKVYSNSIRSSLMGNRVSGWRFDEGAGTTTADTVGASNGTLVSAPAWKSGADCLSGSCLNFDGADDYINIASTADVNNIIAEVTVEAWAKANEFNNGVFVREVGHGAFILGFFGQSSPKVITFHIRNSSNVGSYTTYTFPGLDSSSWNHYVGTWKAGQWQKLYINGIMVASSAPAADMWPTKTGIQIACRDWSFAYPAGDGYFNGLLDEVRIYNSALTASAVREQYAAGLDKLLAKGQITNQNYQQRLADLNSTYAANK
jgi:prepilin-type N-terminal cleavage/methylation domain-containing protein